MKVDEWMGWIQEFLEARIKDAPDQRCAEFAEKLWDLTADDDAPDEERTTSPSQGRAEG